MQTQTHFYLPENWKIFVIKVKSKFYKLRVKSIAREKGVSDALIYRYNTACC